MTRFAILNNRITVTAVLVIALAGISTYNNMPRSEDPGFIIRTAMVSTYFPGASPERVEQLITDRLEEAVQEMPELDFVSSTSKTGVSVVMVNVREEFRDMRPIWDSLRRKIDRAARALPEGVIGPFINDEFGDVFGIVIGLTGGGYSYRELEDVADQVRRRLLRGAEVAKVELHGVQDERVFIEYNNARLSEIGLSPGQLKGLLEARNIVIPGGSINVGAERIALEPSGNFESVDGLKRTVIGIPGSADLIYLEDIVTVRRGYVDPPQAFMHNNGVPAIGIGVSMREGGNMIAMGEFVNAELEAMREAYPYGIEFEITAFLPEIVEKKVGDFVGNLVQAVAIVMAVMLLTLGLRTGLIVASLIPSAIVFALFVMGIFDIGLNQISLAALIIALGMLVDNAIVMAESVMVRMQAGDSALDAAVGSAAELRIPLLTSSLTTAAAFLPIYLAESAVGEYTSALFTVVTITLLCSWLLALTLVPMLCVAFMKVKPNASGGDGGEFGSWLYRFYRGALVIALRNRLLSVVVIVGVFAFSMQGFKLIPFIFFPPNDRTTLVVEVELPATAPIERTREVVADIERFIDRELRVGEDPSAKPGVTNWSTYIGNGGPRFVLGHNPEPPSPNYAFMMVNGSDRPVIDVLGPKLEQFAFEHYPELRLVAQPLGNGPPVKAPVEYRLYAGTDDRLFELADQVKAQLKTLPGINSVTDTWGRRSKKFLVRIDQDRARRAGVSNQDIAVSLQTNLSGFDVTEYREGDEVIPVTLRSIAADRQDVNKLESLNVFAQATGRSVPLKQVADVQIAWEPASVKRRDRERMVAIRAQLETGTTSVDINAQMQPWLDEQMPEWGVAFRYETGGDVEASGKANASINEKLPIAGLIILLLLVAQFNSWRRPAIILMTIPLGLIGVVAGLLIADSYFGFMTFLGVISLSGIVINNAIVLLERINLEIEDNGLEPKDAVVVACQRRLRPILLTTATTSGGLVPLWLGGGVMFEPMAVAILFGLLFATALTLGVVPVLYSIFFRVNYKGYRPA